MKHKHPYFKYITFLSILLASLYSHSQQDPQFTHYMYNMSIINPAYTSAQENVLSIGSLYRSQWVGVNGAPRTGSFFARAPINKKMQAGLSFTRDNVGKVINENNIYADLAYAIPVSDRSKLSFGLKAGLTIFKASFDDFNLFSGNSSTDVAFNENINKAFPNIGIGAFYFSSKYYIGLSSPNVLKAKHIENENGIIATGVESIHYFLTGGYVFNLSNNLKFKPSFMVKAVDSTPISTDISTNVLIHDKLELGINYRLEDAISALANFRINKKLRIGYAYDYTTSNLGDYSSGSHEVFVLFDIDLLGTGRYDISPRFF